MTQKVIYLHGFASSPASLKANALADRFAQEGIRLEVPDLSGGNFRGLNVSRQLEVIERATAGGPAILIGSSLGGYLAALYAARRPQVSRIVLLAAAFRFARRWIEYLGDEAIADWRRDGSRRFFHYGTGREEPLDFGFLEDALGYEDYPSVAQPSLVLHGQHDDVVPVESAREFARRNANCRLRIYPSGHQLLDVIDRMWGDTKEFLNP
jgi:pimeloyl-ACP methyl ester carboxylesterase